MSSAQKKNTFFGGVAILTVGTILVKIIGALYKIPLVDILGRSAYGDFNAAYNLYSFFLTISTAGLPVALSKMISEASALDRRNQVQKILRVALFTFLVLGTISFFCMSVLGQFLADTVINLSSASYCVMALSPAVFCVCVMSAFRGYAQGHSNMVPTTVSQIIESFLKLVVGLGLATLLAYLALPRNIAAAGAAIGVSFGTVVALIYLMIQYTRARRGKIRRTTDIADSSRNIFIRLLKLGIPITLGSAAVSIVTLIDTNLVVTQLKNIFGQIDAGALTASGGILAQSIDIFHAAQATAQEALLKDPTLVIDVIENAARDLYGTYSATMTVYNLPMALMVPLTASVIPAVSACRARHDRLGASRISESALRVGALLCLPMGVGLFFLGTPIVKLLFRDLDASIAGPLLSTLGLASIFVCVMLICNSILQAHGMVNLPILTVVVGGVVKLIVNWTLVGNTDIMIYGAPVGTLSCFIVVALMDLFIIYRTVPAPPHYGKVFLKPLIASALMGAAAWGGYGLLTNFLHLGNTLATIGAICVGGVVYVVLVLALRVISREDLELMPKGDKIAKFLHIR